MTSLVALPVYEIEVLCEFKVNIFKIFAVRVNLWSETSSCIVKCDLLLFLW